ncbi:MAG: hypothetical protein QM689_06110 [Oscillospiraceae bacterium]
MNRKIFTAAFCVALALTAAGCGNASDSAVSNAPEGTSAVTTAGTTAATTTTTAPPTSTAATTTAAVTLSGEKSADIAPSVRTIPRMKAVLSGKTVTVTDAGTGEVLQTLTISTELPEDESFLEAADLDFDGQDDLRVNTSYGTPNVLYSVWLYDTDENEFVYNASFSALISPQPDAESHTITSVDKVSATDSVTEVYQYNDGKLVIIQKTTVAAEGDQFRLTRYEVDESGELVKTESVLLTADELKKKLG